MKLTPIAHAVRFAMRCGITDPKELAQELECTLSAVYRAIKQLKDADRAVKNSDRTVKSDRTELTVRSKTDRTVTPSRAQSYTKEPKGSIFTDAEKQRQSDAMRAALTTEVQKVIWTDDHKLKIICPIEHAEQLKKFGNDEARLNLALEQAAGYIQPNNVRPLLVQVRAQLAQQAAWKTDSDKRYQQKTASSSKTLQDEFRGIL